jgi:hypothetical protein
MILRRGPVCASVGEIVELPFDLVVGGDFAGGLGLAERELELAKFAGDGVAGRRAEVVDEQAAVKMVKLVLDGPAQ